MNFSACPFSRSVRVLEYHGVNPQVPDGITITPEQLEWQMALLQRRGLAGVTVAELCAEVGAQGRWPDDKIALTFDDGYRDCFDYALPILRKHGFRATVFVITDSLSRDSSPIAHCHPSKKFLRKVELEALRNSGWELGSHTCSHRRLPTLVAAEQAMEIQASRDYLRSEFGVEVNSFCHPGGKFNALTLQLLEDAGYHQAVVAPYAEGIVIPGSWWTVERAGIYPDTSALLFRLKISRCFRWLQRLNWRARLLRGTINGILSGRDGGMRSEKRDKLQE